MAKKTVTAGKADDLEKRKDVVRGILAKDEKGEYRSLADIAGNTHFAGTEKANIKKTLETLVALEEEDEAENEIILDQSVWALTDIGRLRAETTEEEFIRTLEANYVWRLIQKYRMQEGKETVPEVTYDEEWIAQDKDNNVMSDEHIQLLTVDKRKSWEADGTVRQALVLPKWFGPDILDHDVEHGGYPYKNLLKATACDISSKVVMFRVPQVEYGLLGAAYWAAKQNDADGLDPDYYADPGDFELGSYTPEVTGSKGNVIPIAYANDIVYDKSGDLPFGFGPVSISGAANTVPKVPYWMYHGGSMIIIISEGFCSNDALLSDAIGKVINNKTHVYVVYVESSNRMYSELDDVDLIAPDGKAGFLKALVKYDASCFDIAPGDDTEYYNEILSGLCCKYGLTVPSGYPRREFVDRLTKVTDDMRNEFMDQLLAREANRSETKVLGTELLSLLGRLDKGDTKRLKGWELLNSLQGMEGVKKEIKFLVNAMKLNKARMKRGMKCEPIVACMFAGAPGTAKTSVAEALSDILAEEHLLPGRRFVSVSGSGLQAGYVGQTSMKVRALAENDVILIDECYSLSQSAEYKSPYAAEALAELCCLLTEAAQTGDKLYIFAGYGGDGSSEHNNLMKKFLESNPGIKSRISTVVNFPSYSAQDMGSIFMKICSNNGFSFEGTEASALKKEVEEFFGERVGDPSFGNGREARNLVAEAMRFHSEVLEGKGIDDISEEELSTITAEDVRKAIESLRKMEVTRAGQGARIISLVR